MHIFEFFFEKYTKRFHSAHNARHPYSAQSWSHSSQLSPETVLGDKGGGSERNLIAESGDDLIMQLKDRIPGTEQTAPYQGGHITLRKDWLGFGTDWPSVVDLNNITVQAVFRCKTNDGQFSVQWILVLVKKWRLMGQFILIHASM